MPDENGRMVEHETACNARGSCRERTLECTEEACEIFGESGDPALVASAPHTGSYRSSDGRKSRSLLSYCDDAGSCYRQYIECDADGLGEYDTVWQTTVERCSLLEESGDSSLSDAQDIEMVAQGYTLLYTVRANLNSWLGPLQKGYNLIQEQPLSREQVLRAPVECRDDYPAAC